MARLRLSISKDEPLRFLGHLDFMRAMARTWRRTELPLAYSEGFNPHMKVSYDSALGVGVIARPFYTDIELTEEVDIETVKARLMEQLPQGIGVDQLQYIAPKAPKLMAWIDYERYRLTGPINGESTAVFDAVQAWNERTTIPYRKVTPKKVRDIDVRPMVPTPLVATIENDWVTLVLDIHRLAHGAVKPREVWEILRVEHGFPVETDEFLAARIGAWRYQDGALLSPFTEEAIS